MQRQLSLGSWPTVNLDDARRKTVEARGTLTDGGNPARGRHRAADTLSTIAETWAGKQGWAPSTEKRERYLLAQWLPALGSIPAAALTPADIRPVILDIEAAGHGEIACRVRAQIGRVMRYAVGLGRADRDVAADLSDLLAPVQSQKYATLTMPEDIAELMRAIDGYNGDPSTAYALRLLPLVFTRPGELRNAKWVEFDLEGPEPLWRIPGERMKMRRKNPGEHLVPLSRQAAALLKALHGITGTGELLFPGLVPGKPISDATINYALRRMGYGPDRIVGHGFGAMASTQLNEQGIPPDVIELQLAHVDSSIRAINNRATRLPERRKMMHGWADYLDALKAGGNVVPFRRGGTSA